MVHYYEQAVIPTCTAFVPFVSTSKDHLDHLDHSQFTIYEQKSRLICSRSCTNDLWIAHVAELDPYKSASSSARFLYKICAMRIGLAQPFTTTADELNDLNDLSPDNLSVDDLSVDHLSYSRCEVKAPPPPHALFCGV